ncbi:uncharacterized protein LOC101846327 [Aplysia californica]|uniref:Uncharacterized protein LOC101846327 n=1 Tax=Aplysia californica TaxID=6500 RepID=A0ABM0KA53_APLCA|nr:uncharacterized protein LOC101846327 [Aplysia californica]
MASTEARSPVTPRPQSCPYQEYVTQQQRTLASRANFSKEVRDGQRLWRQMMMGFMCAGFVGLVMLVLGTIFISEAVRTLKQQPITVMLCVMGIVFGIIILVGTFILGRVLISRKWIRCQGRQATPASQCFHTCSVIYSPSLDQLGASESMLEPPPSYDSVVPGAGREVSCEVVTVGETGQDGVGEALTMVLPPKYSEVTKPLPEYTEEEEKEEEVVVVVADAVPPYKETESEGAPA